MANQELIDAIEVSKILNISIHSLRDYRKRGLIVVAAKRGNKDLYDKADILRRYTIIREKRKQGFSLSQISLMVSGESVNLINTSGPIEPTDHMSTQELLHGFVGELYRTASPEMKASIDDLSRKWNIRFRTQQAQETGKKSEKKNELYSK
jgi:DNA-binding transcriptional MerR regulator